MLLLVACQGEKDDAKALLADIHTQYDGGNYTRCLALIDSLRTNYPDELSARREALKVYQQASLAVAQQELAVIDSA